MASTVAPPYRLTVHDALRMVEAGILDQDDRVELHDGVLVEMSPIGPEHRYAVIWLIRHFASVGSPDFDVAVHDMFVTRGGLSFVMPDLQVIPRLTESMRSELTTSALLVIEVAQSSQRRDREKAAEYAAAAVPEYWIVDVEAQRVTVHRDPGPGGYGTSREYGPGEEIVPSVDAPPVRVSQLLGV